MSDSPLVAQPRDPVGCVFLDLKRWRTYQTISVYFDPEHPDESCGEQDVGPRS